jgi:ribokinase
MYDIITLGSATMDVFIETEKNTATMQMIDGKEQPVITYRSGEKVLMKHLQFEVGGGGTNTAVCFSKLGLKTAYLGNIGSDINGQEVLKKLKEEKIDFIGTQTSDLTNYSIVLESTLLHDRTILVYKGASEQLSRYKVPALPCAWLYLSSLADESFAAATVAIGRAKENSAKIAYNPSNYQIENNKNEVLDMLKKCDVAIMNKDEAILLTGEALEAVLIQKVRALGPKVVAVTLGSQGVIVSDGTITYRAYATPNVPVKETTGAGDCFASSFVAALAYEKPLDEALRWGLVNVESHIQHVGAKAGLLTKTELQFAVLQDTRPVYTVGPQ